MALMNLIIQQQAKGRLFNTLGCWETKPKLFVAESYTLFMALAEADFSNSQQGPKGDFATLVLQ